MGLCVLDEVNQEESQINGIRLIQYSILLVIWYWNFHLLRVICLLSSLVVAGVTNSTKCVIVKLLVLAVYNEP